MLYTRLQTLLQFVFPHRCISCQADFIRPEQLICARCKTKLPVTGYFEQPQNPLEQLFAGRINLSAAGAAFYFSKDSVIQRLMVELKYRQNTAAGLFLGEELGKQLARSERFQKIDCLVPLPLHPKKEYLRGYNQARLICEGIVREWQKPILTDALIRLFDTRTQTRENRINRWENMQQAFFVPQPSVLTNRHILLVDDVVTTGASLEACAARILEIPGTRISIATVAFTP